ncbi:nucleotidyltransferase family protein [Marimonas arenosa]|uniref:Nucleotidyltransferase family protein n=1 Tax=Marimonas arenosa TaxID=1795305 RepID=A0AAE3WAA4_9RHOB|nr:nucleotidyltransferase family protein [Marimonas arenosa]MDQ2088823.1 nucleotidyltransferase family protein [Marimonas arenosa]
MTTVLILIPAAGAARRMRGRDKLLEDIDGEPALVRQVRRALATGARVYVPLSQEHPQRAAALAPIGSPALLSETIDGRDGMSVSIRAAARLAQSDNGDAAVDGLMILPADMPELETDDLKAVIASFTQSPDRIHRGATADGRPGHPVIFPRRLFPALDALTGDEGARSVLTGQDVCLVALPENHALTDLDTPEEWAAWSAARCPGSG